MQLHESKPQGALIQSFNEDTVTIRGQEHSNSLYVLKEQIFAWSVQGIKELTVPSLQPIIQHQPQLIIIGINKFTTDDYLNKLDKSIQPSLLSNGIGCEFSALPAACRTWNLLLAEQRKVVLALVY